MVGAGKGTSDLIFDDARVIEPPGTFIGGAEPVASSKHRPPRRCHLQPGASSRARSDEADVGRHRQRRKRDGLTGRNSGVKFVYTIIDALVHGLYPSGHIDLPAQRPGLVSAGKGLQLGNQLVRLARGDKFARLHRVHQQLELGELKFPLADEPARRATLAALYIQPQLTQGLHVVVDALALGGNAVLLQGGDELGHRHGMVLVGLTQECALQQGQL